MEHKAKLETAARNRSVSIPGTAEPGFVTLMMMNGQKCLGRLAEFHPQSRELILLPEPLDLEHPGPRTLLADDIAYIAFHPGSEHLLALPAESERWRIRVAGGEEWLVHASPQSVLNPMGFVGRTVNDERFCALYFYRHGVNSRERDTPLGAILLASGLLERAPLEEGVVLQRRHRSMPIGQILVEQGKIDPVTIDEAADLQKRQQVRIGEVLREAGLLSARDLEKALQEQRKRKGRRLGEVLVELKALSERDLALSLGLKFGMPFVDLDNVTPSPAALSLVGPDLIEKHGVLPVDLDDRVLTVAISDPTAIEPIAALRAIAKRQVHEVIATASALKRRIDEHLRHARPAHTPTRAPNDNEATTSASTVDGVARLLNEIIADAQQRNISHVHIESNGKQQRVSVRYRVGDAWPVQTVFPPIVRNALVARLKAAARLDLDERRLPQQGSAHWPLGEAQVHLQLTTLPNAAGDEDVVLRLRPPVRAIGLNGIGLSTENLRWVKQAIDQPKGLVLCTGGAGSGKTTLLHALLGSLGREGIKVATAEAPIEIVNPGFRQLPVDPDHGLGFARAAKALLAADPDVLMLGDLEDAETVGCAIKAVLQGRLVVGGVCADGPAQAVAWMECAGVPHRVLARVLTCVIGTRIVRALCRRCSVRERAALADYEELAQAYGPDLFAQDTGIRHADQLELAHPRGCDACAQTGYHGRLGLHEVLMIDGDVRRSLEVGNILSPASSARSLLQDGILKVLAGQTDLAQIMALAPR